MARHDIVLGFIVGGLMRGLLVGFGVVIVSLCFTSIKVQHLWLLLFIGALVALLFSLAGFLNGLYAKKFDDISIIPTFVLTPLIYLGGVFYSVKNLAPFWYKVSLFNPMVYIIDSFRYSMFGASDVHIWASIGFALILIGILYTTVVRKFARMLD
jgi:ABC-2 type transport system permease protein